MKASELRIMNYVMCRGALSQVSIIKQQHIGYFKSSGAGEDSLPLKFVKPIELTEKWLLKFGFEIGYNQKKMLDVYCKDFGLLIERSNSNNFYYKKVNIQNVHQLQNLYFALTGEEL